VFHYRNTLFHVWIGAARCPGVNTPLDQLYRLQDRVRFVQTRQRERDTIPSELIEVDREYQEKVEAVDRL
jgi:hypothetical protein